MFQRSSVNQISLVHGHDNAGNKCSAQDIEDNTTHCSELL